MQSLWSWQKSSSYHLKWHYDRKKKETPNFVYILKLFVCSLNTYCLFQTQAPGISHFPVFYAPFPGNLHLPSKWVPNNEKIWFIIVGVSIVRELPELFIKYVKVFVPQRNSKARSEKMDIAILLKSPQQILLFPLLP